MLKIIPEGEKLVAQNQVQRVWSLVCRDGAAYATYYAEWPIKSAEDHEVTVVLVMGAWGEEASLADRYLVCVKYRDLPESGFMVQDPDDRAKAYKELASRALPRQAVLENHEIKQAVFELLDEIWTQDHRIKWKA